jgi:hypothetical protein
MKALDLTVYERDEYNTYYDPDEFPYDDYDVDIWAHDKRFTDAELAAEVWHSIVAFHGLTPSSYAVEEARRNGIVERFATTPSYDEQTA